MYAGFWRRVAAALIDGIILGIVLTPLNAAISDGGVDPSTSLLSTVAYWLYYALMESSSRQATLGKMALQIKVTDLQGARISFGTATVRYFSKILSGLILGIGFLMVAFTEKKQGLHDMIANTLVVKATAVPAAAPGAQSPGWGQAPAVPPGPTPPQAPTATPPTEGRPEDQPPR
jgi:uncharacterized RDD family membrane protein YckC